ncbi:SPOR domain-containing protein [Rhizobium deserti]|uniref:SPOR domain-containing protein n=1 Tax=Rhizobium deserti TaxID=2547961 RepID=A0A4R5ULY4_9HYPH|nr:SPOR domain-containing protein [Rhizobium deserti]TDK38821.1 SPOR domain-containing protein [Rhizobium deserti]
MADHNLARSRNDAPGLFADDDPLAELARIVGYDERLVPTPENPVPQVASQGRREPAFNLEDELLLEFEQYDAPRLEAANDTAVHTQQPADYAELHVDVLEPVEPEESAFVPEVTGDPSAAMQPLAAQQDVSEPVAYHDEHAHLLELQNSFESEPEAARVEPSFDAADYGSLIEDLPALERVAPSYAPVLSEAPDRAAIEQQAYAFDLASELETSIGAASVPVVEAPAKPESKRKDAYVPGFRMPLANFNPTSGFGPGSRPGAEREVVEVPNVTSHEVPAWDLVLPKLEAGQPVLAAVPVANATIADVPASPGAIQQPVIAGVAANVVTAVSEPVSAQEPVVADAQSPAAEAAEEFELDPFADEEFELALDDLELDLADVVVEENSRRSAAQLVMAAPAESQPIYTPATEQVVVAEPVFNFEEEVATSEPEADLPFDPALITEAEERPEVIAELDVPSLPVEEPEHEPAYRAEYDIDIDAELATLLASPAASAPAAAPEPPVAAAAPKASEAPAEQRSIYADLDEFERALEEDFRRSLATPLALAERYPDGNAYALSGGDGERRGASRIWILPLAFAGVLAVAGAGAYAWLGDGVSGMVASGEPVIITADKEPIKVAPANPGGKTVPNQDKAVYDRVAGAAPETPKQQTLISSNEEPVDVVQKTLMPDTLPLEGENDIEPTDVGETEDPRLLPQEQPQQASAQDPVTVTPRKVKTMIVRPDGKLVEQEVTAPAPAVAAIQSEKMPAAPAKSPEMASMPRDPIAAPAMQPAAAPARTQASGIVPVSAPITPASEPVAAVKAQSPAATPALAQPVATATPAAKAPVPAMRPAQQPVNVVAAVTDQGNVRAPSAAPPPVPAATAANQVASLGDGGYVIQIASLPSQAEAQKSYQSLSTKFGNVIAGRGVDIKQAEIAGKGTFYRVRIPAGSKPEAVALCERYRSAGGTCLVAK